MADGGEFAAHHGVHSVVLVGGGAIQEASRGYMYDVSENSLIDCEGGKHAMRCDWNEGEKWIDARAPAFDLKWNGRKEWNRWVEPWRTTLQLHATLGG